MGMYTKFCANLSIRTDEFDALSAVHKLTNPEPGKLCWDPSYKWPEHPFFHTERGYWALYAQCCGDLGFRTTFDIDTGDLRIAAEIKNYGNEYDQFMDWVSPYLDAEKPQLAWEKYEECRTPTVYSLFPKPHSTEVCLRQVCLNELPQKWVLCDGHRHQECDRYGEYIEPRYESSMDFEHLETIMEKQYENRT